MTPGARVQATIEAIGKILSSWESEKRIPADKLLENYFKTHRYIGSKDRASVAELTYWVLRHKATLEWWLLRKKCDPDARWLVLAALMLRRDVTPEILQSLTRDSRYSPEALTGEEIKLASSLSRAPLHHESMPDSARLNYPEWMDAHLRESFGTEMERAMLALSAQAPVDLRVNTLKATREELVQALESEGLQAAATPLSATGVRLSRRGPVFATKPFKDGWFEMQDEGSQLVAQLADARPGHKVIDFCAGAGGKTLAMAADMRGKGRILAWDNSEKRLAQLGPRLRRAGVDNVQTHLLTSESDPFVKRHKLSADRVLVDAPCSGTGTWRRNPDLKWRFTPGDLQEILAVQQSILQSAARLVKPGGRLIYATCSVLKEENEDQVAAFLKTVHHFTVVCAEKVWDKTATASPSDDVSYLSVTPHQDGVDGFFAAVLERAG